MTVSRPVRRLASAWAVLLVAVAACSPEPTMYQLEPASLNKGGGKGGGNTGGGGGGDGSEVVVSSVFPASGSQGETLYMIKVSGSGFESGAKVAWERNGVADPLVRVVATRFKSSTELEVDIAIDETAVVANYDVSVTLKSGKRGIGIEVFEVKEGDPNTTWLLPLDDNSLSLRSDRRFPNGGMSVYAHGQCSLDSKIFVSNGGGDGVMNTQKSSNKSQCERSWILVYPDGSSESLRALVNLNNIQRSGEPIVIGSTVLRGMAIAAADQHHPRGTSHCGRIAFGDKNAGKAPPGSTDMVEVTRIDARTWRARSLPGGSRALCEKNGNIYLMHIDFTVVADFPLP